MRIPVATFRASKSQRRTIRKDEIEHAKEVGIPYYHIGYWIENAATMHYEANYGPNEVLKHGVWQRNAKPATIDGNGAS